MRAPSVNYDDVTQLFMFVGARARVWSVSRRRDDDDDHHRCCCCCRAEFEDFCCGVRQKAEFI